MASRGTVKLLWSEGNSFPGRPPNRWATDSLFPKKPWNKLPNLLYNLNKNNTFAALKIDEYRVINTILINRILDYHTDT